MACDGADLRVNLEVVETVDYVGASLLKALRPLDVVGLVEAGAQFEQRGNFLADFLQQLPRLLPDGTGWQGGTA